MRRVETQAAMVHDALDKTYKLKMEELKQRRTELDRFYDTVQGVLSHLHIERMTVLDMAQTATAKALANDTNKDDKALFRELATSIIKEIPNFGDRANESLDRIVKALPQVSIPDRLISFGGQ